MGDKLDFGGVHALKQDFERLHDAFGYAMRCAVRCRNASGRGNAARFVEHDAMRKRPADVYPDSLRRLPHSKEVLSLIPHRFVMELRLLGTMKCRFTVDAELSIRVRFTLA
jgi:hypothetical protein